MRPEVECGNCGEVLPDTAAFCYRCGTRAGLPSCGQCGAELVPGWAFCSACGTPVDTGTAAVAPAVAERRLTSVLFADLVGYTTISEQRDTEDVRDLLSAYFDTCSTVIKRYGGTVEKFIGDAVMAVWGVPVAREDDAERAVRAGLELVGQVTSLGERLAIPGFTLRVGIVTGEVTANLGARDQGMVAGDPVNTAARVQAAAGPGEVLVDATTRSLSAAAVAYVDAGEHALKGKAEPARLHRAEAVVAAIGGLQRVDGLEAPLVGRDRDLRLLKELFHATEEARRPHLVVIDGEGGIGKSRLAWELEKYADGLTATIRWHRGRCLSYGDGVAFWALAEAVRARLVASAGDEPDEAIAVGLERVLHEHVPDEAERSWLRPRVASLLGEESREFQRDDLFAAWTRFLERVAGDDLLVLLIDDAQHLDDGLAEFLDFIVTRASFACFVVLLARPELLRDRPQLGGRRVTPLRLEPLAADVMADLVDGLVDGLADDLRHAIVERAGGIPLYAVETVRALIDRDLVVPLGGRYVVTPDRELDLATLGPPASLHALVAARLDALDPVERRVIADASVLGEAFTREGVGILADDVEGLDDVLDSLVRKQLVGISVDRFSAEHGQYRFLQTVVRQVAYGTLSRRDRRSRHLAVADHLEHETERADELAQIVARHLLDAAAASGSDDAEVEGLRARAGDLLVRAGERAFTLGAYDDAVRTWSSALACLDLPGDRARVLERQAQAHLRTGRHPEALAAGEESLRLYDADDAVVEAAAAAHAVAWALSGLERNSEARELAVTRLATLDALTDVPDRPAFERARMKLLAGIAGNLVFTGSNDGATPLLMEALRLSNHVDEPETFLSLLNALAIQQSRHGSQWVARALIRAMADRARADEEWGALMVAQVNLSVNYATVDLHEAVRLAAAAFVTVREHGLGADDTLYANQIDYCFLSGDWDTVRQTIADVLSAPVPLLLAPFCAAGAVGLLRWAGAEVTEVVELPDRDYGGIYLGTQEFAEGSVALGKGDAPAAVELLGSATALELDNVGLFDDLHVFWTTTAFAALGAGLPVPDGAVAVARRARAEAGHESVLVGYARVIEAFAAIGAGEDVDAETEIREGLAAIERAGVVVWAAHTREHLGRWLVGQGRAEEAELELAAAEATYERLGATAWLDRVRTARPVTSVGAARLQ